MSMKLMHRRQLDGIEVSESEVREGIQYYRMMVYCCTILSSVVWRPRWIQ